MTYIIQAAAEEIKQYIVVATGIQTSDFFTSQSLNTRNTGSTFNFLDLSNGPASASKETKTQLVRPPGSQLNEQVKLGLS